MPGLKGNLRKALLKDVPQIRKLLQGYAKKGLLLDVPIAELYEQIRSFRVYSEKGKLKGCCSLRIFYPGLGEIRSLAVEKRSQLRGIGSALVGSCEEEAKSFGIKEIFTLTYVPGFFRKQGFRKAKKEKLPQKVWAYCINCPKFPDCDEKPMLKRL